MKRSTRQILESMEAPESVLAKFDQATASEAATQQGSTNNSTTNASSETDHSEDNGSHQTGTSGYTNELGDWDNAEIEDYDSDEDQVPRARGEVGPPEA